MFLKKIITIIKPAFRCEVLGATQVYQEQGVAFLPVTLEASRGISKSGKGASSEDWFCCSSPSRHRRAGGRQAAVLVSAMNTMRYARGLYYFRKLSSFIKSEEVSPEITENRDPCDTLLNLATTEYLCQMGYLISER